MVRKILWALLIVVYAMLALFGFLSGMLSEGLIGCTHPMAGFVADAMVWLGLVISLSAVACPVAARRVKEKPILRGMLLAIPFILWAIQLLLGHIADML